MPRNATHSEQQHHVLFGSTSFADGIPQAYLPEASCGPVFFEGLLVLDLSFQTQPSDACPPLIRQKQEAPLTSRLSKQEYVETLRLFNAQTGRWQPLPLEVQRFEYTDLILFDGAIVWEGALDTSKPVISSITQPRAAFLSWRHFSCSQGHLRADRRCKLPHGNCEAEQVRLEDIRHAETARIEGTIDKARREKASARLGESARAALQAKRRRRWGSELRSIFL